MRILQTRRRFAGLIAVVVLVAGITAASAQTEDRRGDGKRTSLELTYKKWFEPGFPNMVGSVEGDMVGPFGGAVLNNPWEDPTGRIQAIYIVRTADASRSLTIRVDGGPVAETGTVVLDGRVVDGSLRGARARAEFRVVLECEDSPDGMCFEGTISIKRSDDD